MNALLPLIAPLLLEAYNSFIKPQLAALEGKISSPDLKVVYDAIEAAINSIAATELPKL